MRVQIVKDGVVIPGQEERYNKYATEEAQDLKRIDDNFRAEDPELYKDIPQPKYDIEEGKRAIIAAAYRFGNGNVFIEVDE